MYDSSFDFTINFWFKKFSSSGSGEDVMINNRNNDNGVQCKFQDGSYGKQFVWKAESASTLWMDKTTDADTLPQDTNWHMWTLTGVHTNASSSACTLTIDNDSSTRYNLAEDSTASGSNNSDYILYIASENNDSGFWKGYLTEFSIWNRVLSSDELTTIFNNKSTGIPQ